MSVIATLGVAAYVLLSCRMKDALVAVLRGFGITGLSWGKTRIPVKSRAIS